MSVSELIKRLSEMDQNAEVVIIVPTEAGSDYTPYTN